MRESRNAGTFFKKVRTSRRVHHWCRVALVCAVGAAALTGCSSAPSTTQTGFLSDYTDLTSVSNTRMRFISPELKNYGSFIVDPVQMSSQKGALKPEDRAEVARYFRESLVTLLRERGYALTDRAGSGTARVRVALTNVHESTWWMKLHPGSSLAGAGRAGAAMEGEIIDSVTGEQLAAVVQSGVGSQFTVGNFSTVADVKNVIDQWVKDAGDRFDEMRAARQ
jgi:hypothetical protein